MKYERVLHLNSNRWNSAITEYSISMLRSLVDRGVDCYYVGKIHTPSLKRASKYCKIFPLEDFNLSNVEYIKKIVADFGPTTIITYGGSETFLTRFLKDINVRVVRFRGQAFMEPTIWEKFRQYLSLRKVNRVILPSMRMEDELKTMLKKVSTTVIPLGIDTKKFQKKYKYTKKDRPQLLIFGRLDPIKGHREFMKIFSTMLSQWNEDLAPRPLLKIIGEEQNLTAKELTEAAGELGLAADDYEVHCDRVDANEYLSEATLGVIPSLGSELVCRVALEFLCCGTPIIHSNVGSLGEVELEASVSKIEMNSLVDAVEALRASIVAAYKEDDKIRDDRSNEATKKFRYENMANLFLD